MADYNKTMWINNETVVDAQKLNKVENQVHLLTESALTNADRLATVEDLVDTKIDDVETKETDDGTIVKFIANKTVKEEIIVQGGSSVKMSETAPTSTKSLWVDISDEDIDTIFSRSGVLEYFQEILTEVVDTTTRLDNALKKELDPGYFLDKDPDFDEPPAHDLITYKGNPFEGTVKRVLTRRGRYRDLVEDGIHEGELAFTLDTECLYIGNKGKPRLVGKVGGGSGGSSGGNLTGDYVALESPDRSFFRIHLDNSGKIHVTPSAAYDAKPPEQNDISLFTKLKINHVFGGGPNRRNNSKVSHSFIELYNDSDTAINLRGLSVQVAGPGAPWKSLELVGIVPARRSFLIRCNEVTDENNAYPRLIIREYDMDWDEIEIPSTGFKTYLTIGITPCTYTNPANINGANGKAEGYIDLIGVGGKMPGQTIDAYEKAYLSVADIHTSIHRIDFKKRATDEGGGNHTDWEPLNWLTADPELYFPRCSTSGKWDIHYDKIKLNKDRPMLINVGFGQDGNTTRTFTWQTPRTYEGWVKYRKQGESKWKFVESSRTVITHGDGDAMVHSAIIRKLTPGTYEYIVGEEGRWSDMYTLEVKVKSLSTETVKILQISDQQAREELGYIAWKKAMPMIANNNDFDFIINTGDISDSANKSYEWRYYYEFGKQFTSNYCHMTCCGNNDLIDKKYPDAFRWYSTYENEFVDINGKAYPSVYSWNQGDIHFVCLNSNVNVANLPTGAEQPTPLDPQIEWLRNDLKRPENKKRWTIAYTHESPYTIVNTGKAQKFHNVFAEFGVDLVMCGHHHMYSRSHGLGPDINGQANVLSRGAKYPTINPDAPDDEIIDIPISSRTLTNGGVVYIMSQATGSKLAGKTAVPDDNKAPWRGNAFRHPHPSYVMYEISHNQIKINAYEVLNIHPVEEIHLDEPKIIEVDNLIIVKKEREAGN